MAGYYCKGNFPPTETNCTPSAPVSDSPPEYNNQTNIFAYPNTFVPSFRQMVTTIPENWASHVYLGNVETGLHVRMTNITTKYEQEFQKMKKLIDDLTQELESTKQRVKALEGTSGQNTNQIAEVVHSLKQPKNDDQKRRSYIGEFVWIVEDFYDKQKNAINGDKIAHYSDPFWTSKFGYKFCAKIYPYGDGLGKSTHIALYIAIFPDRYDKILKWPFKGTVIFTLINKHDAKNNITYSFTTTSDDDSFQRPRGEKNVANGTQKFVSFTTLEELDFVNDGHLYIKVTVKVNEENKEDVPKKVTKNPKDKKNPKKN